MLTSLPNILTLSRIVIIPLVVALFYVPGDWARWAACGLFALAAITDYFDGYFARSMAQVSAFGRFLDPIADKLLVAAVLFLLVGFDRIDNWSILPATIILLREILVSGLREFLAATAVSLPVTKLSKWKTTIQMVAIGFLLVGDAAPAMIPAEAVGIVGLWIAGLLTLVTGYDYTRVGLRHIAAMPPPSTSKPAEEPGALP